MTPLVRNISILALLIPLTAILYRHLFTSTQLSSTMASATTTTTSTTTTDMPPNPKQVIVVGSGLAGLTASLAALRHGAPAVHLLERAPKPGGNSIKASSGINGAGTRFQAQLHFADSRELFYDDTVRSAGKRLAQSRAQREKLIATLTERSAAAVEFLTDDLGIDLSVVARLGGHSAARTHRGGGKMPPGAAIVTTLLQTLKADDKFTLETDATVTGLVTSAPSSSNNDDDDDGLVRVRGVEYIRTGSEGSAGEEKRTLLGPVVFATGGFAGDTHGLLERYRPDLAGMPSTNDARPGAHGILTDAGAELVDMDSVQVHPTGFVDPAHPTAMVKFLAAEMLRGEGGILLRRGRRFVNELETREVVSRRIMGDLDPTLDGGLRQWDVQLLLDPGATEAAANHIGFYLFKGLVSRKKVQDLDEATRQTLEEYAKVVRGEAQDPFGRSSFGHWRLGKDGKVDPEAEVCVGSVTPITHFTMGGALINEKGQVLASKPGEPSVKKPLEGLWAAGEITGGIHGDNRLGGSSLLECVVFGQIIGEEAGKAASGRN